MYEQGTDPDEQAAASTARHHKGRAEGLWQSQYEVRQGCPAVAARQDNKAVVFPGTFAPGQEFPVVACILPRQRTRATGTRMLGVGLEDSAHKKGEHGVTGMVVPVGIKPPSIPNSVISSHGKTFSKIPVKVILLSCFDGIGTAA